jgi:hypothetical protein
MLKPPVPMLQKVAHLPFLCLCFWFASATRLTKDIIEWIEAVQSKPLRPERFTGQLHFLMMNGENDNGVRTDD